MSSGIIELEEPVYDPPPLPGTEYDEIDDDDDDEVVVSANMAKEIDEMIMKIILFSEKFCGIELFPNQREVAYRIAESVITNDGAEITVLQARQSGKTATIGTILTGLMILLPRLAKVPQYSELLDKFKEGFWVGVFAPTDNQAETLWGRIHGNLTSKRAKEMLIDPEIDDKADKSGSKVKTVTLRNSGSFCRMQTAYPKANIESKTYHFAMVDEAQDTDATIITRSIWPMLAFYNGSRCMAGTGKPYRSYFYEAMQSNKREYNLRRRAKQNHFEYTYKTIIKYNKNYKKFIAKEKARLGEDSDEFQMSYCCKFLLEQGQFVTEEALDECGDKRMDVVGYWGQSGVVVGIDPARINDSTVVTVMWVDWDRPDAFGFFEHRILNWLEIHNKPWEQQYVEIASFIRNYNVLRIGVDAQGLGGPVAERIALLFPGIDVVPVASDPKTQSERWTHLKNLIERRMFVYPAGARTRRVRAWKRFHQQFVDLLTVFSGKYMLAEAPTGRTFNDDYCDSACIAAYMTKMEMLEEAEFAVNPMVAWRR